MANSATSGQPSSTFLSGLQPTAAPSASAPCAALVIQLTTTLVVPDFSRYYPDAPIASFQPSYSHLADGSLLTRPFLDDILHANVCLLVTGILVMLFARNIFVSADYIRRVALKNKTLFYVLFTSQALASLALIPTVISQFNQKANCTTLDTITTIATVASLSLLIIWILGYKAYRCLNSSRLIIVILSLFLVASIAIAVLEVVSLRSERRLSGGCIRTSNLRWIRIYLILQFVESFFICCCFLFSVWRTRRSPRARGRISLQLDLASEEKGDAESKTPGIWGLAVPQFGKPDVAPLDASCNATSLKCQRAIQIQENARASENGRTSVTPSTLSRIIPRIDLFRDVMKDELYYTTFITASCVGVAAVALFGVNTKNGLSVLGWISLNWAVISLLAVSSFGRVIRRHERETVLQEPGAWMSANLTSAGVRSPERQRRASRIRRSYSQSLSSRSWRSWRRALKRDGRDRDSYETEGLTQARESWNSSAPSESFTSITGPESK